MKSQNQISLKILALALLFITSCEVWAVNFGQSQSNPLFIQTQITETRDNQNVIDQNLMFKPAFSNLFTNDILALPELGRVYSSKYTQIELYEKIKSRNFARCTTIFERINYSSTNDRKLNFYKENFENDKMNYYGFVGCGLRGIEKTRTNGKGGGSWTSPNTWRDGKVPQKIEDIVVAKNDVLIIDSNVSIETLSLEANSKLSSDKQNRIIRITNHFHVGDSASISNTFESGKLDCYLGKQDGYLTAYEAGKLFVSISKSANVSFENLNILSKVVLMKGTINVMNFSAIKQKDFIAKTGTVLNIGQKK